MLNIIKEILIIIINYLIICSICTILIIIKKLFIICSGKESLCVFLYFFNFVCFFYIFSGYSLIKNIISYYKNILIKYVCIIKILYNPLFKSYNGSLIRLKNE